jgi:hypothetical protein
LSVSRLFCNAHNVQTHHGPKIPRDLAGGIHYQDMFGFVQIAALHLLDAGIVGTRRLIGLFQQQDFARNFQV